ncbi:MAG: carbamoyltransferase HypF [Bacteroidales bacterium]|nr:carbamoyltransferase HypF [Bacteroidales bacterium]MCF8343110.1 carbamoyltransferase HypF [Bacteroidales bacterium]MCF8349637.1 carbamoyltransferase HypF [Bacteroidales bacterium]MCF8376078.1 carbamoyltransferase HypF [Bacteroidales bacterium]MCF8400389.1 carbamoyltransferase HypF [Bacteroidales bacterium]
MMSPYIKGDLSLHSAMEMKKENQNNIQALDISIAGLVQGVGFRPFIFKLALDHGLTGWVENRNDGVKIHVEGNSPDIESFFGSIKEKAPVASQIHQISQTPSSFKHYSDFRIVKSENISNDVTEICPDIAVCDQCLTDMRQQEHRLRYPFINCTNCGPRFTIIKDLPYDREKTTMQPFVMCELCHEEYTNMLDRRFHAQPVACKRCGPKYGFHNKQLQTDDLEEILKNASQLIDNGEVLAIKGLGGFHLACNALDNKAVKELRSEKNRDGKPFAVMFRDLETCRKFAHLSEKEKKLITSWRKPIVLLKSKKELAEDVCVGFDTVGAMLPYMPIHYLLFDKLKTDVIVLTSGNISDEPILIDNQLAGRELGKITDHFLDYNRDVHNRTDDSVTMVVNNKPRLLRRSRGYVPNPVNTSLDVEGIMATGAELVNCFCIGKNKQALLSQHIGDLKNLETLDFYTQTIDRFKQMFRAEPKLIAADMHPDYLSSRWAAEQDLPVVKVQHHHAHIASCMAEHELDEEVIGIAMDGVGYGSDGHIWGGEFLRCDLNDYKRYFHLEYIPMPGGDAATKHPWRMAVSYLYHYFGEDFLKEDIPFLNKIDPHELSLVRGMLKNNMNSPLTSSTGRLFDAVAALTGLCLDSSFHAEAPMRLESIIGSNLTDAYSFKIENNTISLKPAFEEILRDIAQNEDVGTISARFHNTVININFEAAKAISEESGLNKVVLSGGTFQNRYLLEKTEKLLQKNAFNVYTHGRIPANDGGLALGQLLIAAKRRSLQCV